MRCDELELRHIELPMHQPFETSTWKIEARGLLILAARQGDIWFYGETSPLPRPTYNEETEETAKHVIEDFVAPAVREADSIADFHDRLDWMKGHRMARAAGDFLLHHKRSIEEGRPLADLIGGDRKLERCGVSVGMQDEQELVDTVQSHLDQGYQRVKLKIRPGQDIDYVGMVRDHFPEIELMADANSAYSLDQADRLAALDRYDLTMIEQPLGHRDIVNHGVLNDRIETPICLDESIRSAEDIHRAARADACDIINLKPQRVGGLHESRKLNDACREHGIKTWIGSVLESGIGMSFALAAASLGQVSFPGDLAPASRYFERGILEQELPFSSGEIPVPDTAGLPAAVDREALEDLTVEKRSL